MNLIPAIFAILSLIAIVLLAIKIHHNSAPPDTSCTPTDKESKAAGGDSVSTFTKDAAGACVAEECVEGYDLADGICSKAADVKAVAKVV